MIRADSERSKLPGSEEDWPQFLNQNEPRNDFAYYRIVPTASWTQAEFLLEDEQRNRIGSYVSQSRVRADLELHGKTYQMYIQRTGAFASEWAGKVGGSSDRSIVIRNSEAVVTELFPARKFPAWAYSFTAEGQDYRIDGGGWLPTKPLRISRGIECVGIYVRDNLSSRKVLLALRHDLPDAALLAIMVAALLQ
jgi:hypothetical protein